jgi:hypothetical protein
MRSFCVMVLMGLIAAALPARADDTSRLHGLWQLVAYEVESQATGEKEPVMGRHPTGHAVFTPEGRVFFIFTSEGRKSPTTVQERADLLDSLIAYTGTYRVEGDQWITRVDTAWNPQWVSTEQARTFKVDGERLEILTPWRMMPNWPGKGTTRSIVTFERAHK